MTNTFYFQTKEERDQLVHKGAELKHTIKELEVG